VSARALDLQQEEERMCKKGEDNMIRMRRHVKGGR
jgi:hypothetical protein